MEGVRYALLVLAIVCFVLAAARVQAGIDFVPAGFALVVGAWLLDELNMRVSPP